MCPQADTAPPAAAAPGQLRPGTPVCPGCAHSTQSVLRSGDTGEPASQGLCARSRGPARAAGPTAAARGSGHKVLLTAARAELLSPQNVDVSSPQGSIHSGAQRTGASGRAPRLSLPPSLPMGPWPASWHCCSWREVTRFSRLRGMRPTCTGGSPPAALRGFTPSCGSSPPVPSALVGAEPLPSLLPGPATLRGLPHRLSPSRELPHPLPRQLLLGSAFQKVPFLKA